MSDLREYIYTKNVGDKVRLTITRGRKNFGVEVKLREKIIKSGKTII